MNLTPLGQRIVWFGKAHEEVLKLVEGLSDEQLAWWPHPSATSIAFNVWHLARWIGYLQAQIPKTTPVLSQRLILLSSNAINIDWQNSVELTARIILGQKTIADRPFAQSFPQYIAHQ